MSAVTNNHIFCVYHLWKRHIQVAVFRLPFCLSCSDSETDTLECRSSMNNKSLVCAVGFMHIRQ